LKMLNYFLVLVGKRNLKHLVIIVLHWRLIDFILLYYTKKKKKFCFCSIH
jgi:hypothetical protein